MRWTWAVTAVFSLLLASCGESRPRVSVARYSGEPNGDDAALVGTLAVNAQECLVVRHTNGEETLVAFPTSVTRWDADTRVLTISTKEFVPGDEVVFGGSAHPIDGRTPWSTPPDARCISGDRFVWFAGDSASHLSEVPGLWTPTPLPPGAPTPTPAVMPTYRKALERDAAQYAERAGISLEEAIAILERQVPPPPQNAR